MPKLPLLCAIIAAAALTGCAGADVAVNAPDGSARGFCQTGLVGVPTLCFVRAAPGETVIRSANGSEDASAFLSGAGVAASGAGGVLFGARYRPDVSNEVTNASAPTNVAGSRNSVSVSASARSRAIAHARAVARQHQLQAQEQRQRQRQQQEQQQDQKQKQHQKNDNAW